MAETLLDTGDKAVNKHKQSSLTARKENILVEVTQINKIIKCMLFCIVISAKGK